MRKFILFFTTIIFLGSCQKDDENIEPQEPPFLTNAGNDVSNIDEFEVDLNASTLKSNESGLWTIHSGLVDEKVFFDDDKNPKTTFHGLPDEEYKLIWKLTSFNRTATDTINVTFAPLKTEIINISPEFYKTRIIMKGKYYDKGEWTFEGGEYHSFNPYFFNSGFTDMNSPTIKFYGFENTSYKLTWTTWYGSKSASVTLEFQSRKFQQDEALEDLNILNRPWRYKKNDDGNVVEVNMTGDAYGSRFRYLNLYPSLQSLIHLKKLNLFGDGFYNFPNVIGEKYHELEVLNFGGNAISSLPQNIGNLQKLDTLIFENNQNNQKLTSLPSTFGNLKNLRYLSLSSMGVRYLPDTFGNLTNLTYLNMSSNRILKLPENFGNLKKLEVYIGGGIDSDLPRSFSQLENLRWCSYWVYPDNVSLPEDIGSLTNLVTLRARGKYKSIPESFGNLSNLRELEFTGGSEITDIPESFGSLSNLGSLRMDVRLNNLPNSFENLASLKSLQLHGYLYNLPVNIGNLYNLEWLSLDLLKIKEIPESIGQLSKLKTLILSRNEIKTIPETFGNLSSLYMLDLSYNQIETFPESIGNLSNTLFEFIIRGNNYSNEELDLLKQRLPSTRITNE
jgi:Leucine-rich repeat (LRR) protein